MAYFSSVDSFDQWRARARELLANQVAPADVVFNASADQPSLFDEPQTPLEPVASSPVSVVPRAFLDLARNVACHRDGDRWHLLYRILWRLSHGEPHLLKISTDDDVHQAEAFEKAVRRDAHKMKAFVRFRLVGESGDQERFVAWHRPDHRIVRLTAPFFVRRFRAMNWTILTPHESASWDQHDLTFGPGAPATESPDEDALEDLWKTYYASIFNPARVNAAAMKREMPVRYWSTMPETDLIDGLLDTASSRTAKMLDTQEGFAETASHYLPGFAEGESIDLASLRQAATHCQACDLHQHAHQTVFGEGSSDARMMVVGEQPGDREDLVGRPFMGPAGELLDELFRRAGIQRDQIYLTNAVKHFKFVRRGKKRLHQKPGVREMFACRPWLEAELAAIRPDVVVCLGATAAQAILGRDFRLTSGRGKPQAAEWCDQTIATWHPSAILRADRSGRREEMIQQCEDDLRFAADLIP